MPNCQQSVNARVSEHPIQPRSEERTGPQEQPLRALIMARPSRLDWLYRIDLVDAGAGLTFRRLLHLLDGLIRLDVVFDLSKANAETTAVQLRLWCAWFKQHPNMRIGVTLLVGSAKQA